MAKGDFFDKDVITYDPLSETTRKERMALLGLSMLGVALVKVPLIPEKISFLGVDFAKINQVAFVQMYALVVAYYVFAFAIYGFTDYVAWRRREVLMRSEYTFNQQYREPAPKRTIDEMADEEGHVFLADPPPPYSGGASYWLGWYSARFRAVFEFLLPIAFSLYSLASLLRYVSKH